MDVAEFERWRTEADTALRAAQAQGGAGVDNWACFLAEQASQLAIKAPLHGLGTPGWGHDLVKLGRDAAHELDEAWPDDLAAGMRRLSRHYVASRYPDAVPSGTPSDHYGPEDAAQALVDARAVLDAVDGAWIGLST